MGLDAVSALWHDSRHRRLAEGKGRPLQASRTPGLGLCSQVKLYNNNIGAFLTVYPADGMQPPLCVL